MAPPPTYVVVGAGQAGGWAVRTLREEGFDGRIVLIGEEPLPPYERPPLSKALLLGEAAVETCFLWPEDSYRDWEVELRVGRCARRIDAAAHEVELDDGERLGYRRLMLATGSRPRRLAVPGADLPGVHMLRSIPDSLAIRDAMAAAGAALVVGGGWIGLEVAAALRKTGCRVVLVETLDRLCARALAPEMSAWIAARHAAHGVELRLGTAVERFAGDGALARAVLTDGTTVEARLAVIGIGVVPNSELAAAAGLAVDNGVVVDEMGRTSDPDIFAAGDVTNHPNPLLGRRVRLESWENAQNQAIAAAKAMLDKGAPYAEIPWFWSDQYDANIQLVGLPAAWDEAVTRGDPDSGAFVTFYLKGDRIEGAVAVDNGRDIRFAKRLMQAQKTVSAADLADPTVKLQALLKR